MNASNWHWPQWVYLALLAIELGISLAKHGEPKEGNHSVWSAMAATALVMWFLIAGGFFK